MSTTDNTEPTSRIDIEHGDVFRIEENGHRYKVWEEYTDAEGHERIELYSRKQSHRLYLTREQIREAVEAGDWVPVSQMG